MSVPTFSRFRILLRLHRPHEPSSRPPGRPSQGEVEAGGHGSGRSKQNSPLVSIKGLPSAVSTRNPSPATRRFWASYISIFIYTDIYISDQQRSELTKKAVAVAAFCPGFDWHACAIFRDEPFSQLYTRRRGGRIYRSVRTASTGWFNNK